MLLSSYISSVLADRDTDDDDNRDRDDDNRDRDRNGDSTSSNGDINWMKYCEMVPDVLLSAPCDELVNDDNELTAKGKRELLCLAFPLAGYLWGDFSGLSGGIIGKFLCNR